VQDRLSFFIQTEAKKIYSKQLVDITDWIGEPNVKKGIDFLVSEVVNFDQLRRIKLGECFSSFSPIFRDKLTSIIAQLFSWTENHLEQGLKKINLTGIAARQVENFPVHMLERMIVSITGKELKMITVLGALLGGLIGAVQGLLV